MADVLWQLIVINLISTFDVVVAPMRVTMTMGAVDTFPWWFVLLVAAISSSIGSLPIYVITRLKISLVDKLKIRSLGRWKFWQRIKQSVANNPIVVYVLARLQQHMFIWLIVLLAIPGVDWFGTALAGRKRYPFWRFFAASIIGRCFHNLPLVIAGLLLARYPWFHGLVDVIRHPITSIILIALLLVSVLLVTHRLNKARVQYNKAQAVK